MESRWKITTIYGLSPSLESLYHPLWPSLPETLHLPISIGSFQRPNIYLHDYPMVPVILSSLSSLSGIYCIGGYAFTHPYIWSTLILQLLSLEIILYLQPYFINLPSLTCPQFPPLSLISVCLRFNTNSATSESSQSKPSGPPWNLFGIWTPYIFQLFQSVSTPPPIITIERSWW